MAPRSAPQLPPVSIGCVISQANRKSWCCSPTAKITWKIVAPRNGSSGRQGARCQSLYHRGRHSGRSAGPGDGRLWHKKQAPRDGQSRRRRGNSEKNCRLPPAEDSSARLIPIRSRTSTPRSTASRKPRTQINKFEHHSELFAWAVVPALALFALPASACNRRVSVVCRDQLTETSNSFLSHAICSTSLAPCRLGRLCFPVLALSPVREPAAQDARLGSSPPRLVDKLTASVSPARRTGETGSSLFLAFFRPFVALAPTSGRL